MEKKKTTAGEQALINEDFKALSSEEGLLPIKVSKFYKSKVDEEVSVLGHTEGPLHRAVFPSKERITLRAPSEKKDFVDDRENMQDDSHHAIIRKYKERILFLPTSNCLSNCQYCFRQDVLNEEREISKELSSLLEELVRYLNSHSEISEVILSGGDPMTLPFKKLKEIIETIKHKTDVESIRLHTRSLIFNPSVFSEDKMNLFGDYDVRLVSHIIHPYEICDVVKEYIEKLLNHNIRLYNQFPILRKVNDHSEVLIKHIKQLDELHIRNLSIFIPDPINFSAAFRVKLSRLFSIIDEFNWNTPSWINSTRLVLDSVHGKVRREDLKSYDEENGIAIFERNGKQVYYPDLPEEMDEPGDLETLLWKDN